MSQKWTTADIASQDGRLAVVTGANSGIGLIAARELSRAGAQVILACRNTEKGASAEREIRTAVPAAKVTVARLDLADLGSVREFAAAFIDEHDGLDLLINNAGIMAPPRSTTVDGFEMQIGTNHLGHFALTGLLLGSLNARSSSRVVTVSSGAHRIGKIRLDDLQSERSYKRWSAYGQSKLANLLFTFELDRRARAAGLTLKAVAAHPGYAATNLQSAGPSNSLEVATMKVLNRVVAQSADAGALPTLYAATVADLPGGSYIGPSGPGEMRGHPKLVGCSAGANDQASASSLWEVSQELTGVSFEFASRGGVRSQQ